MIFYFTGTGNSMWVAKTLEKNLHDTAQNIVAYKNEKEISIDDALIGFSFPTYMSDLPWIVKEFLLKLKIPTSAYCFVIMTSNHGESGKSFKSLSQVLESKGSVLSAAFDLQMPGNCIPSTEEENDERLKQAPARMSEIITEIQDRCINFHSDGSQLKDDYVKSSYFYGTHSLKRLTFVKDFSVTKSCTGCGICAKVCPMENIKIVEKQAIHGNQCVACYACVHWCPEHATLPKVPMLKHRSQYVHPEITLKELIESEQSKRTIK